MKKRFLKITFSMLLTSFFMFQSCTTDNFEEPETSLELQEGSLKMTPVVEKLIEKGYKLDDIVELDSHYLVEGDMLFSKDIKDYQASQTDRHYQTDNLVNGNYIGPDKTIYVYSEISDLPISEPIGNSWRGAIDVAIDAWNSIGSGSCVRFELTTIRSQADIRIVDGVVQPLIEGQFGFAEVPSSIGAPGDTIYINLKFPNHSQSSNPIDPTSTTFVQKRNIIVHEMGHTIGFAHTDMDNGNPILGTGIGPDPSSIMRYNLDFLNNTTVFSTMDIQAVTTLYGSCITIGGGGGNIDGPSPICLNEIPSTYTWSGSGTIDDWVGTSNLSLSNETGTSVRVSASGSGTLTAFQNGELVATKTIQTSSGPIPVGAPYPTVNGPSTIFTGPWNNSQLFYVSNANFVNGYTNVEWVIFSNVYPNAGQHFQIQSPVGNNPLNAVVTANTGTPEETYTIQCRISDGCGTYYINKTFTVDDTLVILF